jgi:hypothetical protein
VAQRKKEVPSVSDVALVYAPTADGAGARVLRTRNGAVEAGEVRPVKEGQPINSGEVVRLSPRQEAPFLFDVEVLHQRPTETPQPAEAAPPALGRPAQVATDEYRMNWDRIFGGPSRRTKRDSSLN